MYPDELRQSDDELEVVIYPVIEYENWPYLVAHEKFHVMRPVPNFPIALLCGAEDLGPVLQAMVICQHHNYHPLLNAPTPSLKDIRAVEQELGLAVGHAQRVA